MSVLAERFITVLSDRYRIERELGRGGMATVYLAHDVRHDRKVAVKILHAELAAVLGAERFLSEIKTTASLQHPHILPLFDSGQVESQLFYVMPFVDGESLRDRLTREKQLPLGDAVRIAREVADALEYAHSRGVIHRDIKPENILLQGGHALVADFGIALAVQHAGGERMTQTGLSLGTPQYMSPEQAMGEKTIDRRSDVYSLGAVLYEMLSGEPPFVAPTGQALIAKILTDEPRPLTQLRKSIPPHVDAATRQALEKLPADRFDTAAELSAALANPAFVRSAGERASSVALGPAGTWRTAAIALGAAALVLAGALTFALMRARGDDGRQRGVLRVGVYLPDNQQPRDDQFNASIFSVTPDGSGFVYAGPAGEIGGETQLWIRRWNQLSATPIAGTTGATFSAFSPDGKSVAFLALPLQLKVVSLTGGLATIVADSGLFDFRGSGGGLAWGDDGMLYVSGTKGLLKISPNSRVRQRVSVLDSARGDDAHVFPDLLPNGKGALVTILPKNHRVDDEAIGVVNFATGVTKPMFKGVMAHYLRPGRVVYAQTNGALMVAPFDEDRLVVTGPPVPVADTAANFAITRQGDLVYAKASPTTNHVVWVDRNGIERGTWSGLTGASFKTPRLSPDGRRLAISMNHEDVGALWIARADGGPMTRLTFDGSLNERPAWTPDGQRITFPSDRAGSHIRLFERRADGGGPTTMVNTSDARRIFGAEWSPRGDWLLFRTDDQAAGNGDIMGIRPGVDTVARPFVATPAQELAPAISPDGRWLAYSSDQTGRREVFVRPFPETDRATYQVSADGGAEPLWSRDGRELFYRDERHDIVSVPIAAGATFERGAARLLFDASNYESIPVQRNYDVTPDGQRFVMIRPDATRANRIVAVFGFLDELKAKVAK